MKSIGVLIILFFYTGVFSNEIKDSTKFYDYYLLINGPITRNFKWDIGIERIAPLYKKINYVSQFSFTAGKFHDSFASETYYNPRYFSFCLQPIHVLIGSGLVFETGISTSLQFYRYEGKQYSASDTNSFTEESFNDAINLIYSIGLRYFFKKPQLSLKLIIGPAYQINLQNGNGKFLQSQTGEIGISWRLRKKIKKMPKKSEMYEYYEKNNQ